MKIIDFSRFLPGFKERCEFVAKLDLNHGDLSNQRDQALAVLQNPQELENVLDALHHVQRLYFAASLNILNQPEIVFALLDQKNFPTWSNYASLPATAAQQESIAKQLYEGYAPLGPLIVFIGDYARGIGELVVERCLDNQDEMDVWIDDRLFGRRMMHHLDRAGIIQYGELMAKRYQGAKRRIIALSESPSLSYIDQPISPELENLRQTTFMARLNENGLWRSQQFTGTFFPSHQEAAEDDLSFEEYVRIYFAMCEVDIAAISKAHEVLIELLNKGEEVHITNSDGTDIRFGIKGMTFLNSLTEANIPGTEVFSAPEREKVNGIIVAKGWFNLPHADHQRVRDITLEFYKGRIVRAVAEEGEEYLTTTIETDEGSHYLGELALGTNPALTRHVSNGLLVEKIGGSFHVAIGNSYENEPTAIIHNGNKSLIHWDITTMLRGRDGMIAIDGEVIMQDGVYLDPRLAYLNGK